MPRGIGPIRFRGRPPQMADDSEKARPSATAPSMVTFLNPGHGMAREALSVLGSARRAFLESDTVAREKARFGLAQRFARAFGFEVYNAHSTWLSDPEFWDVWTRFPDWRRSRPDRKFTVWSMARSVADLEGDTAECGVFEGATSYLVCAATDGPGRSHHLFDSFEGLSVPGATDIPSDARSFAWSPGDMAAPESKVRQNLASFPRVRYHRGWIPERFGEVADRRFCFVHIDVDLYQPTRDATEFFYERLVPGGILVNDDYGSHACPGARRAFDEVMHGRPEKIIELPTAQAFIVKR